MSEKKEEVVKTFEEIALEIDNTQYYDGDDLGIAFEEKSAVNFKTWAPLAQKVEVILFTDSSLDLASSKTVELTKSEKGTWVLQNFDCSTFNYYRYRFTNVDLKSPDGLHVAETFDMWSKSVSNESFASQIADIRKCAMPLDRKEIFDGKVESYINPWGVDGSLQMSYSEAVIYEMHIRDWSRAFVKDSTGKFRDLTRALNEGAKPFASHLKELGITHVQLLPSFEYSMGSEDCNYNWGYNPRNFFVPSSRYVEDLKDGTDSVLQMREMIQAFHQAGIAVVMDVVFNHTNDTGDWSVFDATVPKYFYRMTPEGWYANGSGCGNECATNHLMMKKYVIDCLKHWMLDYHVNGFRFDLMGCHETNVMKEIYEELNAIDHNVMVYGEPWTGGLSSVVGGAAKHNIDCCSPDNKCNGVACFNDDFRNAIKGGEFGGFAFGQLQGKFDDGAILRGLTGSVRLQWGFTEKVGRSINYCECHDNYTLFDKLAISHLNRIGYTGNLLEILDDKTKLLIKREVKLAGAYILLAQGTPFLDGGQEFMRTKQGVDNSYKSEDYINEINMDFKENNIDVFNTYKALISLRKAFSAFNNANQAHAWTLENGVTHYRVHGTNGSFIVLFNATDYDYLLENPISGKVVTINEARGEYKIADKISAVVSVLAHNFKIIKMEG